MPGISHEDGCLDHANCRSLNWNSGAAVALVGIPASAEGIVEDLASLQAVSTCSVPCLSDSERKLFTNLRVAYKHELSARALGVERVHRRRYGVDTLDNRVRIADSSAR